MEGDGKQIKYLSPKTATKTWHKTQKFAIFLRVSRPHTWIISGMLKIGCQSLKLSLFLLKKCAGQLRREKIDCSLQVKNSAIFAIKNSNYNVAFLSKGRWQTMILLSVKQIEIWIAKISFGEPIFSPKIIASREKDKVLLVLRKNASLMEGTAFDEVDAYYCTVCECLEPIDKCAGGVLRK